jgi:DNA polymerase III subunit delta
LIIVENLLQRFDTPSRVRASSGTTAKPASTRRAGAGSKSAASGGDAEYSDRLLAYLPTMPTSTRLFLVESKTLNANNPILKYAQQGQNGYVREFKPLGEEKLRDWLQQRTKDQVAQLTREGANLLAVSLGHNLRLLDQELAKLAGFVGYGRPITADDVRTLVNAVQEADIFGLVDALGLRQREQAIRRLQELLASGANELYLLTMVARQFRLILAAKDLAMPGTSGAVKRKPDEIGQELNIRHGFIVDKLLKQAQQFSIQELEEIQRRILAVDQALKTGRSEGPLALELLVVEICQRPGKRFAK